MTTLSVIDTRTLSWVFPAYFVMNMCMCYAYGSWGEGQRETEGEKVRKCLSSLPPPISLPRNIKYIDFIPMYLNVIINWHGSN